MEHPAGKPRDTEQSRLAWIRPSLPTPDPPKHLASVLSRPCAALPESSHSKQPGFCSRSQKAGGQRSPGILWSREATGHATGWDHGCISN
jgi:hypothetical protein